MLKAGTTSPGPIKTISRAPSRQRPSSSDPALDADGKFTFTFSAPGTYDYFCSLHTQMIETIVVEAATGADAVPWCRVFGANPNEI
jgi:hypothetical protein